MKKIISLLLVLGILVFNIFSAIAVRAKILETTEILLFEDFEPPVDFTGEFTDVHTYYSMFNATDIANGNFTGYKGWNLTASAGDEQKIAPSIYHVAQRADVGDLKDYPTTYLDLRRYDKKDVNPSIYKSFGVQDKNGLIVRFSFDLLAANGKSSDDSVYFSMAAKYFATTLTNLYWKPDGGTAQWFNEEEKALIEYQKWNKIEFLVDFGKDLVTLYINGHQVCTPQELKNDTEFKEIRLWTLYNETSNTNRLCLDNLKVEKLEYNESYSAQAVSYISEDGFYVSMPSGGDSLEKVSIKKALSSDGNCKMYVACYNAKDKLIAVKSINITGNDFTDNKAEIDVGLEIPTDKDLAGGKTKIFFWDKENIMNPLSETAVFDVPDREPTLYLMGDSTMANYVKKNFPRAGTGMMLPDYFDGINVINQAVSGAGTDTYLGLNTDGIDHRYDWSLVRDKVKEGDYVLIQLGINDSADDIGIEEYKNNLDAIINTLHNKRVNVIVSTMNMTYLFDKDGKFRATFDGDGNFTGTDIYTTLKGNYLEALYVYINEKKDLNTKGFASIDMAKRTAELIGKDAVNGEDETCRYFICDTVYNKNIYQADYRINGSDYDGGVKDNVHLTIYGANVFAQLMAKEIYALGIELSDYVKEETMNSDIVYPNFADFRYSDEIVK